MASKTIFITGCSEGGIGASLALEAASRGLTVFAALRTPSKASKELSQLSNVTLVSLDVTSPSAIAEAVKTVSNATGGRLDVLINNAGQGYITPIMHAQVDAAKRLFDVNFFAPLELTQAFLPLLIKAKGTVVNNSSIADFLWGPWNGIYSASKAAFTSMSEVLRLELQPLGVRVMTIETGGIKTLIFSNLTTHEIPADSPYKQIEGVIQKFSRGETVPVEFTHPAVYSKGVLDHVLNKNSTGLVFEGKLSRTLWYLVSVLPRWLMDIMLSSGTGLKDMKV